MKCELCHKREAVKAVTVKNPEKGSSEERYVCADCAARLNQPPSAAKKRNAQPTVTRIEGGESAPPFIKNFLEAAVGLVKGIEGATEQHLVCPVCHATWDKLKESGRLGCPSCWKTFAKELQEHVLRAEYGPTHLGAPPAAAVHTQPALSRAYLERELKAAITREDYRKAAALKKSLDALDAGKETT